MARRTRQAGSRAPRECRSNEAYVPGGTNPCMGTPTDAQLSRRPRWRPPVKPGQVIPAPSVNNGINPLPADQLPKAPPVNDRYSDLGQAPSSAMGNNLTRASTPRAHFYNHYDDAERQVVAPDGVVYSVEASTLFGADGWKVMAPTG